MSVFRTQRPNPYRIRFYAVCACGWRVGFYDLNVADRSAEVHTALTDHEVVRAEEIES